jgi:thiamine pyrophosphokinase
MHALIFANGEPALFPDPLPPHDLLLAADGGTRLLSRGGLIPDVILGDLDSLTPAELANFDRAGASIYRFPTDKDQTDLELALDFALQSGATEITLYALFGGRWDMTFANLLLLASPKYAGVQLRVIEGNTTLHLLRGGETLTLAGCTGDTVSVLPLSHASGVTYRGLAYPLANAALPFGTPRGVSNSLTAGEATVSLGTGVLLVVHHKDVHR